MPVRYTFSGNLFTLIMDGSYSIEDIKKTFLVALDDPSFPKNVKFLYDVRKSTILSTRPSEDIKKVAQYYVEYSDKVGRKCAVIASKPVHYGLCRMGASFAEIKGAFVEVFSDEKKALAWLNADDDNNSR